jgi:signal peptidase II
VHSLQGARRAVAQRRPLSVPSARAWLPGAAGAFGLSILAGSVARSSLLAGSEQVVIPHILSLRALHNTGVGFGLLPGLPPVVAVALALTLLGALFYNRSARPAAAVGHVGLGLMIGGASGNIVERLRFGDVLDYLDVHVWPVFNLADAAIVVGAGLLVVALSRTRDILGGER